MYSAFLRRIGAAARVTLFLAVVFSNPLHAQLTPVAGRPLDVQYRPATGHPFASAERLDLVYVFNYWGTRYGTRLALYENVLRPDTSQVRRVAMTRDGAAWTARIDIPAKAALLSYYVTDGNIRDDNNERTYCAYVYGDDGKPVRNARFFMTSCLGLTRGSLDRRLREAEDEIIAYPENFKAYPLFFSLLFEREKGDERVRKKIVERLGKLEAQYADSSDFNNLAARTYFYTLRDIETAQMYKEKVPVTNQWPDVLLIYDRDRQNEEMRRMQEERRRVRAALVGSDVPEIAYLDTASVKKSFRDEKGRMLLIVFWANTSSQSMKALGEAASLRDRIASPDFDVIGINVDFELPAAKKAALALNIPVRHGFKQGAILEEFGVDGIPQGYLVDAAGVVRAVYDGMKPEHMTNIEERVREWLKER